MAIRDWWITIGTVAFAFPAFADEPTFAPKKPNFDDAKLAMKVKALIGTDSELAKANLFVSVLDGVVAVQGPVLSEASSERIKVIAAKVPGVSAVKVDCHVVTMGDPLVRAVLDRLEPKSAVPSLPTTFALVAPLPGLPSVAVGPSLMSSENRVVAKKLNDDLPMPVVAMPLPPVPMAPRPYPTIPAPNVPVLPVGLSSAKQMGVVPAEEIAFSLVDLRSSDRRFGRFTATIMDGVVTVTGSGDGYSDFVSRAKTIPGVTKVVGK